MTLRRRAAVVVLACVAGAGSLALSGSAHAVTARPARAPVDLPTHSAPLALRPSHDPRIVGARSVLVSSNWSGYIALPATTGATTFAGVSSQWTVPTVYPSAGEAASASWIGIDGVSDRALIQTGTAQDSDSTGTGYAAWYEMLPAPPVYLNWSVRPGDRMAASIVETSPGRWTIGLADTTAHRRFSQPFLYAAANGSSAEWVEEAPTSLQTGEVVTLADFGTASFTNMGLTPSVPRSVVLDPVVMTDDAGDLLASPSTIVGGAFTVSYTPPPGYDLVGSDGGVFVFGGGFHGSLPGLGIRVNDITGIVPTARDNGYFLVGSDGGVFAFNAPFANSLPGIGVHVDDIVGIVPTLSDHGYFLVGRDGGVFSFNAPFEDSLPGMGIHVDDIVGIAATADDRGYWLVGSDGSVYAFGDAHAYGNGPAGAVAITATHDGGGYWVVGAEGSVRAFGDAHRFGDLPSLGVQVDDIVGIVVSPDSQGYNLIGRDGGIFTFGDAVNEGSLPGLGVHVDNVVGAVPT